MGGNKQVQAAYYAANKGKWVEKNFQKNYGISLSEYQAMWDAQAGRCAICDQPEWITYKGKIKRLCVDHDHETGAVRSLLCHGCNQGLGRFKDNAANLQAAADYLTRHNGVR